MAIQVLNNYTAQATNQTMDSWNSLFEYLLVKYIDGNIKKEANGQFIRTQTGGTPSPLQPGYSEK